jgi:hypothetical protein
VFRRVLRRSSFAALLVAAALLAITASASATQLVTNGDFETGTLEGWTSAEQTEGLAGWFTYSHEEAEESGTIAPPPSGNFAAASLTPGGSVDTSYLYQDVALPAASSDRLSMYLYYESGAPIAVPTPSTLFTSEAKMAQPNQQVRVDVLKPNAPIESLSPNDILATVYASRVGDPTELAPTLLSADLSNFAGQTVRLRIAAAVQDAGMQVGVDGVSIESTPLPPPPLPPSTWTPPSNAFSIGRLVRDREHGGAKLDVTLPGAGALYVTDARRQIAIGSSRTDTPPRQLPVLVRTASVQTGGPQTVHVSLRPTAAAKKLLAKGGKLPIRLQLTFTPEGGMAATQGYEGTLRKVVSRALR